MKVGARPAGLLLAIVALAGCAGSGSDAVAPPVESIGPGQTVSPAVAPTRAELVRALGAHELVLTDSQSPVRPAESPLLASAPRAVYQVLLPKDPDRGYIVVYEFPDNARAANAATQEQTFLGSGFGRVQEPQGTVYTLRQLGTTVIVYSWLPAASKDDSAPGIQAALQTVGVGFPIPT